VVRRDKGLWRNPPNALPRLPLKAKLELIHRHRNRSKRGANDAEAGSLKDLLAKSLKA
jgi:hypothetical protein